jgi:hypothetical protein
MSKYRRGLPVPPGRNETVTWTYWLSRDSVAGALSAVCSLWNVKPLRTKIGARVTWTSEVGHLGDFRPDEVRTWPAFKTYPETDRELIVVETRPSIAELEAAEKQGR